MWSPAPSSPRAASRPWKRAPRWNGRPGQRMWRVLSEEKAPRPRESMIWAAGEIAAGMTAPDGELEAMLIQSLRHSDKLVRRSAACALGQLPIKTDAARNALADALRDNEAVVRQ